MNRIRPHRTRPGQRAGSALLVLLFLAMGILSLAAPASASGGWSLHIREAACTDGERVLLGEIADPVGNVPAGTWKKLSIVPLWKGPQLEGRQQAIPRQQLDKFLKYYVPELADACALPVRLVVQKGGKVYGRRALEQLVVDYLTPRAAALGGEPDIKDIRIPSFVFLDSPHDKLEIAGREAVAPGRVSLLVHAKGIDGQISRRIAVSAFVNLWKAVPCAAQPLNRLEAVTPDKITFMRKNLAYMGEVWDGKGGPYRMTRSIGTGQPLELAYMNSMPMVTKGEHVNLVYQGSRITLAVKAEAMDDADQGETVQVRNLQSRKVILATVVDSNTVRVR